MNIVLSGPFGMGSLSDEIVLAGVLKPLLEAKHTVTVLSADKEATTKMHAGVAAVTVPSAGSLLSTAAAWKPLGDAHLFAICGAGSISDKGKVPARTWLMQLEHVKTLKFPTALIAAGALFIADKKEQVRVQRLLHHFIDGISVRDVASKEVFASMALNPNRVSVTGDPTLSLFDAAKVAAGKAGDGAKRVAFFFADGVPMRQAFSPEPTQAPSQLAGGLNAVLKKLAAEQISAVIFHDDTQPNEKLSRGIAAGVPPASVAFKSPRGTFKELSAAMASCSAAITDTLHGLLFAAAHGVPAVYVRDARELVSPTEKLGLKEFELDANAGAIDTERAYELIKSLLELPAESLKSWLKNVAVLEKKEAQNVRMMERLVPKRMRYPKRKEDVEREARDEKPKKIYAKGRSGPSRRRD